MPRLFVRLTMDCVNITPESILDYFSAEKTYISSEHEDSNHHYNIVFDTPKTVNAWRNAIKRHFQPKKNFSYCSEDRGRSAIYISKDKNIIKNDIFSEDELAHIIAQSYTKKAGSLSQTLSQQIIDSFPYDLVQDENVPDEYIISHISKFYRSTSKPYDEYVVYRIYNAIENKISPSRSVRNMLARVRNMASRNLQN